MKVEVEVTIDGAVLAWAREEAKRRGLSLDAFVASLLEASRAEESAVVE